MSSAASPPHFFFFVPIPHALREPLALCSPLILSLDSSDGLCCSFQNKIEKAVSHRDVDSFSVPNELGNLEPPIYTFFWALDLSESKPGLARVVPTTGGEHLSIRLCAATGSPIRPKATFNSPNRGSSRVVSRQLMYQTLSFVASIPIRVAIDSVSYVSGAQRTAFGLAN
ncbi:hypothetical protein M9H77_30905 [Catharanthus roseus]|uniref:Uncharacterized protein n=1 Tax=Catharanthus roseus TaxID=4058 RepID=A0ACC0A0W7_CATRO|nr:hypothetical protein M9H77_30905 [Catharanthus roseus]